MPVAEGDDDVIKLQPLRLVNGYQAYAVNLVTLNGLGTQVFLPFGYKAVDACRILAGKGKKLIVEGTQIGTLTFKTMEFKDGVETFCQFV